MVPNRKVKHLFHLQEDYWLVDYDLPSRPSTVRVRLWREIIRRNPTYRKSSESVLFTRDKDFAKWLFNRAYELGATRVSLYRAVLLAERRRPKPPKLLTPPCMWEDNDR